jgi:hypothetical protein
MTTRAKIFEQLDTTTSQPKSETEQRPDATAIDQIAGTKFQSREGVYHRKTTRRPLTHRQPRVSR